MDEDGLAPARVEKPPDVDGMAVGIVETDDIALIE
jgi:hypothetical protein